MPQPSLHHTLIYVRHGQTDWNAQARLQGQRDIALNETGRRQARRNGLALMRWLETIGRTADSFDWVASPLSRATETMQLLRESAGMEPGGFHTDDALREVSFGAWEGLTLMEVAARDRAAHDARLFDKWGFVPPGGESYAMLSQRIGRWIASLSRDTVCVAHGAVHRAVRHHLEAIPQDAAPVLDVPQDRLYLWQNGHMTWL